MEDEPKPTDRRLHLKLKIKDLMNEARNSRKEERKLKAKARWMDKDIRSDAATPRSERASLHAHRTQVVRPAARHSQLAYAFIRGVPYCVVEDKVRADNEPSLAKVTSVAAKFLAPSHNSIVSDDVRAEVKARVKVWLAVPAKTEASACAEPTESVVSG